MSDQGRRSSPKEYVSLARRTTAGQILSQHTELYEKGLTEIKKMNLSRFQDKRIEDYIVAGYNYPVSVKVSNYSSYFALSFCNANVDILARASSNCIYTWPYLLILTRKCSSIRVGILMQRF